MGVSNLKTGLLRKYAAWRGERLQLEVKIAKIEAEYETVEEKRARIARLDELTKATVEIMAEIDPKWSPEHTKPVKPKNQVIPFEHGATTRTAFAIMRELARPTNPAELATLVMERLGGDVSDEDIMDRVKAAIDASLRSAGAEVRVLSTRPTRWEIVPISEA